MTVLVAERHNEQSYHGRIASGRAGNSGSFSGLEVGSRDSAYRCDISIPHALSSNGKVFVASSLIVTLYLNIYDLIIYNSSQLPYKTRVLINIHLLFIYVSERYGISHEISQ